MAAFNGWTNRQIEELINQVFLGIVTPFSLPPDLYEATLARLADAVTEGFGGFVGDFPEGSVSDDIIKGFRNNIQVFSGAKTFQNVNDMTNALFNEEGFRRTFGQFRADADKIFDIYNDKWLRTEFNTATNMAFGGQQWVDAVRDQEALPLIQYETVGDERVRAEHVVLDDIVRPVDDAFWNTHFPPNGWNCRCDTIQLETGEKPFTPKRGLPEPDSIEPLFRMNPGKDKIIFRENVHPYFKVEDRFDILKQNNFGFPVDPV